jgi:hypothetical protein
VTTQRGSAVISVARVVRAVYLVISLTVGQKVDVGRLVSHTQAHVGVDMGV